MEAFGFVEPIVASRSRPDETGTPPPATPRRRSPRIEALQQQPPTPELITRLEMEEGFTRRVAPRKASANTVPATTAELNSRRTRSVTEEIRKRQQVTRQHHAGQKRRASPHVEQTNERLQDNEDEQVLNQDDEQDRDQDEDQDASADDDDGGVDNDGCDEKDRDPQRLLVEPSCEPVRVPSIQVFHVDWEAFLAYLEIYGPSTYQVLVVFETMNAAERNKRLGKQKHDRLADMIPLALPPFSRVYKCTHGPKPKNRGNGVRPRRFIRYTKCPFRFRVQWTKQKSGKLVLKVTQSCAFHNHVVGADSYGTYPTARGIKEPAAIARTEEMVSDGIQRSVIYTRMLAMNQNVYKSDVDNFVSAHMSRVSSREDDEAVARVIAEFIAENPDGVVTIDETDKGESGVISLTTPHMRSMFSRFSELILVDCTHKTNRYDYQLCTFMVMDEFGNGQVVQQSLLETNGDWHMERAVEHLKRANPGCWQRVRVIVVDKDLNELKILKRAFVGAIVLLCHFHVVKYLYEVSRKPQFGKLSKDDHDAIDHLCHNLVYSKDEGTFVDNRAAFQLACDRLSFGAFSDYMHDNWFNCCEIELADIDDPEEFTEFVRFLLAQFRNVRQRKRVGIISPTRDQDEFPVRQSPPDSPHDRDDESPRPRSPPPVDLSQANRLYSAEVGDVPAPCLSTLQIPKPSVLVVCNPGNPGRTASNHAQDVVVKPECGDDSERILPKGYSDPVDTLAAAKEDNADVDEVQDKDAYEHYDEGNEQVEDATTTTSHDFSRGNDAVASFKIKINQKARKSGRPKRNKEAEKSAQRQARAVFNASEKARRDRGELTMADVVYSCDKDQPSLLETKTRVANVPERFVDEESRKPKYHSLPNPTLNKDVFYILPPKLLSACVEKFPLANKADEPINLGTPSECSRRSSRNSSGADRDGFTSSRRSSRQSSSADQGTDATTAAVEVVSIAHVGMFSREQIELMRRAEFLQKVCKEGTNFVTWLNVTVASKVPATLQKPVKAIAKIIDTIYPAGPLPGLEARPEYRVSVLYNVKPPAWLNDGIILAFCERLMQVHQDVQCAGVGSAVRVQRKNVVVPDMIPKLTRLRDAGARHIVLPVNVGNNHWIGVYVDTESKTINCYDPLNLLVYRHKLRTFALGLAEGDDAVFPEFTVVDIQSPNQTDGFSCGLFVCFKFWCVVDKTISKDMSDHGLFTRRLEFLHFVLHGTKIE